MPKISIITVNLNNLKGLQKTINSVINQNFKDFEFIIIDGGSSDGSKEYIAEIGNKISSWISEPDSGIYNAMNKGIRMAKGDYICFLNSGDIFFDDDTLAHFDKQLDAQVGIYYGDVILDYKRKQKLVSAPKTLGYPFLITNSINHQSTFIKRSLFEDLFYYNETLKIVADWEFIIYAVCKKEIKTKHLDKVISIYDASGISSIQTNQKSILEDRQKVIKKHFPLYAFSLEEIETIQSKRGMQFIYIKKHRFAYRILKWIMSFILLFLPRKDFKTTY